MACRCCGEHFAFPHPLWPDFMDRLQAARDAVGRPFRIHSAHRCALHNARVGGAPRSQHLRLAVDIGLSGHDPAALRDALASAGFRGLGLYTFFIHADLGRARQWHGSTRARDFWRQL